MLLLIAAKMVEIRCPKLDFVRLNIVLFLQFLLVNSFRSLGHGDAAVIVRRCSEREREALLAFKQGLVDDLNQLSSWGSRESDKQDCCTWEGVSCSNQTGHVIKLDLRPYGLQGKMISPKLIELQHLEYLDLSGIDFNGSQVPGVIGSLPSLRHLDLSSTSSSGRFPSQVGNLSNLQYLDLSSNDFTDVVESLNWLPRLSSLRYLDLSYSLNLSKVFNWPEAVNKLPKLTNLTLSGCFLPSPLVLSVPSHKNSSNSLAHVDLSGNNLITSSIFLWLSNYNSSLVHLDLSYNHLAGRIPDVFGNMSSLSHLNLRANDLQGLNPHSFSRLCSLQSLSLNDNNLSGSLEFVQILSTCAHNSLEILDLSWNHLAGSLPNIANFLLLKEIYLNRNQLSGVIPESVGQMSELELIWFHANAFEGVISETHFSQLSKLRSLALSSNSQLIFNFSSDWIPPFQLEFISLGSCKMGPHFPKWLQTQKNYSFLDISGAGISDILPSSFWNNSQKSNFVDLSNNQISGALADSRLEFAFAPDLNLSWNQFEGPIPSFLSKSRLLDLSNNNFSEFTSFLCSSITVSNLTFLDLSRNKVSEELPDCWTNFENLVFLDLSDNALFGKIPTTMGSLSSLQSLKLNNNGFGGQLPSSLKNSKNLIVFDVGENKLSGIIPEWLGVELPNLAILILRSNNFYGSMPSQLCNLQHMQILDFSMNNISGSIPTCLNNMTTLAQKGISSLTLSHTYPGGMNGFSYDEEIALMWKGVMSKYKSTLGLVKSIHLSNNQLTGEIPIEIMDLVGLVSLNLSRNNLTGQITPEIGKLKLLQFLDLSRNQIHGGIPTSLFQIYGLGDLDLSNNNLSGKIPMGSQLQNFDASDFAGNPLLCGIPLQQKCSSEETGSPREQPLVGNEDKDGLITPGFYVSLGLGFVVGFWGVCGSLIFNRSWRYAYFKFLNGVNDWLHVRVALIKRRRMVTRG